MSISIEEHRERRSQLLAQLPVGSIVILASAHEQVRNRDVEFAFRQNSDFIYLTGFFEPDSVLVLKKGLAEEDDQHILFVRERDPATQVWTGYRAGPDGAMDDFGFEQAYINDELDERIVALMDGAPAVYAPFGSDEGIDQQLFAWVNQVKAQSRKGSVAPKAFNDLLPLIAEMRLIKSDDELWMMASAADISAVAHQRAMQVCKPGMAEFQLEAEIDHEFKASGARFAAYNSIVGSGSNACILHYINNDCVIDDGDLILIDAGCELDGYASDITRTFPANGQFSAPQAQLYQLVLDAQLAAIEQAQVGKRWNDMHDAAVRVLTAGMVKFGLLSGDVDELIADLSYKKYYLHNTGHWLGLDVHDVGDYKVEGQWRLLKEGMVVTVEPGIYIPMDDSDAPEQYRGIGIRIEDDVAISADGPVILSANIAKEINEIEAIMAGQAIYTFQHA